MAPIVLPLSVRVVSEPAGTDPVVCCDQDPFHVYVKITRGEDDKHPVVIL